MLSMRVRVDEGQCARMAAILRQLSVPAESEEPTSNIQLTPDQLANFYFVLVAICHQTSPANGPVLTGTVAGKIKPLVGWDYLREAFAIAAHRDPAIVYPERLLSLQAD